MPENDGTLHIAMVDDDDEDVYTMRRAMSDVGPHVDFRSFSSAPEFLDALPAGRLPAGQTGYEPQLLLLDINLPGVSGFDLLVQLRKHDTFSLLPVIMISTSDSEHDIHRSYRCGANAFFTKRASYRKTLDIANAIVAFWSAPGIQRGDQGLIQT